MRSPTLLILLATLAATSACSSKDDQAAASAGADHVVPAVSGTRLRARFITAGDARELVGFYDSLRQEECTFQRVDGGRRRCIPETLGFSPIGAYADPACQIPVGIPTQPCGADAKYALTYAYDGGCGTPNTAQLRRVGGRADARYAPGPAGCAPQPIAPGSPDAIVLGEIVPWTEFVDAEEANAPDAPGETILVASDGARQHLGFRLESLDVSCTYRAMTDGKARCMPEGPTGPVAYSDPDCTKGSFVSDYGSGGCGSSSTGFWLAQARDGRSCGTIRAVYSLAESSSSASGDDATAYAVSGGDDAACAATPSRSYGSRRAIVADLTASLPVAARGSGSGRLVPALVAHRGSTELGPGFHDTERDVDCSFTLASDGKLRCLPNGAESTFFFTDGACGSPSRVAVSREPCGAFEPRFARLTSQTCPPTTRVFALGAEPRTLTDVSTETAPGRCAKVAGLGGGFDATEVAPAEFVEGARVTE
jgi:hypothetical protein